MSAPATATPVTAIAAAPSWTATIAFLDHGRYWRTFAYTVTGSGPQVAARKALVELRRRLPKGARIDEVKLHLRRAARLPATEARHG